MNTRTYRLLIVLVVVATTPLAFGRGAAFRKSIFLHHSTGLCIWGPNGSTTSIPRCMTAYNAPFRAAGDDTVSLVERSWPSVSADNEWATWDKIFMGTGTDDFGPILAGYHIIVLKSCFPSSEIKGVGTAADTLSPTAKTLYNYKWHWRRILGVMKAHPGNFFAIWTNAPEVNNGLQAAGFSDAFCRWAKDTLARGLDSFGKFPPNVFVFDYFHKVAGSDGRLKPEYAKSATDSHPNDLATELVAPQFVNEIFDAAASYEATLSVTEPPEVQPHAFELYQNYPNPFNPSTLIRYRIAGSKEYGGGSRDVRLVVYDLLGREVAVLVNERKLPGTYEATFDAGGLAGGMYLYRLQAGDFVATRKLLLLR